MPSKKKIQKSREVKEEKNERVDVAVIRRFADKEKRLSEFDSILETDGILDGRPNVLTYNRMLHDPGISFPLHMLKLPITRSQIIYENPDQDITNFVNDNLRALHWTIQYDALTSLEYGFAPFEKRYSHKNGMIYYKEFIPLDPLYIWIKINQETGKYQALRQRFRFQQIDIPAEKTWLNIHDLRFSKMYGRAQIDYAYVPWLLDREFYRYHGVALQEFGLPTLVGRAPEGKRRAMLPDGTVQDISNMEYISLVGQSVRSESVVVLPSGEDFSLDTLFEKSTGWDFNKDHQFLDLKKALAILLPPELWQAGQTGSYAKSRIQSYWFEQTIGAKLEELMRFVMHYILRPIILINFWDGREMPPLGKLYAEAPSLYYEEFAQKLIIARETQFSKKTEASDFVSWDSLYELMRIPVKPEEGESIARIFTDNLPTDERSLKEVCKKFYRRGIDMGKEELAFRGYVPMSEEMKKSLKAEAQKLKYMLENTSNPRAVLEVVLLRLRDQGRYDAHEFFHDAVEGGNYEAITRRVENDAA